MQNPLNSPIEWRANPQGDALPGQVRARQGALQVSRRQIHGGQDARGAGADCRGTKAAMGAGEGRLARKPCNAVENSPRNAKYEKYDEK